jgi:uncharacterized repeat protein (TIGR03803 family)
MSAGHAAQTFTTLHTFTEVPNFGPDSNNDGARPFAGLILSSNVLYGTTTIGGTNGDGTVFAVKTDGSSFTNLHSFIGSDGNFPSAGLVLSGNTLYGTTTYGGSSGNGNVFAINTDGSGFTNLYSFTAPNNNTNGDGANPFAGLVLSGNILYGTAAYGGNSGNGTVFRLNTNGTGFANLYNFTATGAGSAFTPSGTNSDGANPFAGLILSGSILYGTALWGGVSSNGTVFAINTDGTGFTNLHNFNGSDGANPFAGLTLSGNILYGTAVYGGNLGSGTVFRLNTNGTAFTNLYNFTAISPAPTYTNSDGANPRAGLLLSGNTLYGTAWMGGNSGNGTVFTVNTDGSSFKTLYDFTAGSGLFPNDITNSDGAIPRSGLILSGNMLYGTASNGGNSGGTLFSIFILPQLTIMLSGTNVILTWPTNANGFILQSATNLFPPAVWNTNLPSPVVVNGQNTVTNPISGAQQFYRLSQ